MHGAVINLGIVLWLELDVVEYNFKTEYAGYIFIFGQIEYLGISRLLLMAPVLLSGLVYLISD